MINTIIRKKPPPSIFFRTIGEKLLKKNLKCAKYLIKEGEKKIMGRNKSYNRNEVLQRALDLFWKKGFEGTHLQELVDVTQLNRFSLYKEFGGKEGLFEEAIEQYLSEIQKTGETLQRQPLGLENILEYLHQLVRSDFAYGCFMVNTLMQKNVIQERINNKIESFVTASEQALLENLLAAQTNGEIDKDLDAAALAKLLVVFDIGMVTFNILGPSAQDKERIWEIVKTLLLSQGPTSEQEQLPRTARLTS